MCISSWSQPGRHRETWDQDQLILVNLLASSIISTSKPKYETKERMSKGNFLVQIKCFFEGVVSHLLFPKGVSDCWGQIYLWAWNNQLPVHLHGHPQGPLWRREPMRPGPVASKWGSIFPLCSFSILALTSPILYSGIYYIKCHVLEGYFLCSKSLCILTYDTWEWRFAEYEEVQESGVQI